MALSKQNGIIENSQLNSSERERYSRHLAIPEVGVVGQQRLKAARVLLIGAGGLGAPIAIYLAASGVGHLTIVDHDFVSLSNLQRQILFSTAEVGLSKAEVTKQRLKALNPEIQVEAIAQKLNAENALELIRNADLVIDGTDNFATRYLVNDACLIEKKPLVFGAIFRFDAQVSVFGLADGPCYRCLYPEAPGAEASPNCAEAGVLGILPGTAGLLMATEVIKFFLQIGESLSGKLLQYDALSMSFFKLAISRRADCESCGPEARLEDLAKHVVKANPNSISPNDFRAQANESWLLDVRNENEFEDGHWQGSHHLPLAQLSERLEEIPRDRDLIVVCQSGKRSARAVEILHAQGFSRARTLEGGLSETGYMCMPPESSIR